MTNRARIPPLELEALKVLWGRGEATVREVQLELGRDRRLAYTTVMTLLDRLARRGAAERHKQGRAHVYRPALARETAAELAIDRLAHDYFGGSRERLLQYLQGEVPRPPDRGSEAADSLQAELL
jgi:predicted transcriptional regulator